MQHLNPPNISLLSSNLTWSPCEPCLYELVIRAHGWCCAVWVPRSWLTITRSATLSYGLKESFRRRRRRTLDAMSKITNDLSNSKVGCGCCDKSVASSSGLSCVLSVVFAAEQSKSNEEQNMSPGVVTIVVASPATTMRESHLHDQNIEKVFFSPPNYG